MNDKLLAAWIRYLMGQCGNDDRLCPRLGCPMMLADECRAARDKIKLVLEEHTVMNVTLNVINELRKK